MRLVQLAVNEWSRGRTKSTALNRMQPLISAKKTADVSKMRIVSEEIDKMQSQMQEALVKSGENGEADGADTQVKLARSRRETRVTFILKGSLEDTENRLQKYTNLSLQNKLISVSRSLYCSTVLYRPINYPCPTRNFIFWNKSPCSRIRGKISVIS